MKSATKLIVELLADEDYEKVALSCIRPPKLATQEFLNMLTPFSYQALTEAAMALVFGRSLAAKACQTTKAKVSR